MKIVNSHTDATILAEIGSRFRKQRLAQNLTQAHLAREAGVSKRTVERIEAGQSTQFSSVIRVLKTLGLVDNIDALITEPLPSPLEALKRQGNQRKRARAKKNTDIITVPWTWDDEK